MASLVEARMRSMKEPRAPWADLVDSDSDEEAMDAAEAVEAPKDDVQRHEAVEQAKAPAAAATEPQESARSEPSLAPLPPPVGLSETFAPQQWLTDASISQAYAWLTEGIASVPPAVGLDWWRRTAQLDTARSQKRLPRSVLLMDPATAFWLTAQEDPAHIDEALRGLDLPEKQLILCPVNDSREYGCGDTGTHWTLLVCLWDGRASDALGRDGTLGHTARFIYYDSLWSRSRATGNFEKARLLASRLVGRNVRPLEVDIGSCAVQRNSFDCGMYVLLFTEIVANAFAEAREKGIDVIVGRPTDHLQGAFGNQYRSGSSNQRATSTKGKTPIWEELLQKVTPKDVADRRANWRDAFAKAARGTAAVERRPAPVEEPKEWQAENEKTGAMCVFAWHGPTWEKWETVIALRVLLTYLTQDSISPLHQKFVETSPSLCGSVSHSLHEQTTYFIEISLRNVDMQELSKRNVGEEVTDVLRAAAASDGSGISLDRMRSLIRQQRRQHLAEHEESPHEFYGGQLTGRSLYGGDSEPCESPCVALRGMLDAPSRLECLFSWTAEQWAALCDDWLVGAQPRISVTGVPSKDYGDMMQKEDEDHIKAQRESPGEKGCEDAAAALEAAEKENDVDAPDEVRTTVADTKKKRKRAKRCKCKKVSADAKGKNSGKDQTSETWPKRRIHPEDGKNVSADATGKNSGKYQASEIWPKRRIHPEDGKKVSADATGKNSGKDQASETWPKRRIHPEDGCPYTFEELSSHYKADIRHYWEGCAVERRIDPDDGQAYTLQELATFYARTYKRKEILAYWSSCKLVAAKTSQRRRRAKKSKYLKTTCKADYELEPEECIETGIFVRFNADWLAVPLTRQEILDTSW